MKHTKPITLILISFFLITQIIGLILISQEVQPNIVIEENQTMVSMNSSIISDVPVNIFDWKVIIYLAVGITIGTSMILLLRKIKFGGKLWKVWYFLAVYIAINFSLKIMFYHLNVPAYIAIILAFIISATLAFFKIKKENFYIHNITEILMYTGISTFLVLLFNNNMLIASLILILISLYDMIAVWKSKHMIKLAKFTMKQNLFPGFSMYYNTKGNKTKLLTKTKKTSGKKETTKNQIIDKSKKITAKGVKVKKVIRKNKTNHALLGGGDVVFPLIFTGVILGWLFNQGYTRVQSLGLSLIVVAFSTLSLYLLFNYSKKEKFYPAMPFLSVGCFVGLGVLWLVLFLL